MYRNQFRLILKRVGITQKQLSVISGYTPQKINQQLKNNTFNEEDLRHLCNSIGIDFTFKFIKPDGSDIVSFGKDKLNICDQLFVVIDKMNLSQADVGKIINRNRAAISGKFKKRTWKLCEIDKICNNLGIDYDISFFYKKTGDPIL